MPSLSAWLRTDAHTAENSIQPKHFSLLQLAERGAGAFLRDHRLPAQLVRKLSNPLLLRRIAPAAYAPSRDAVVALSVGKARKIIDAQGGRAFRASRA